jgi:catechol 2,3-dioxygenase-like lactoylglutathione lyase family enzyme
VSSGEERGAPAVRVRGLRHLALRVRDVPAATRFYAETFGMRVVWAPDPENVYLSSGTDNLALHADPGTAAGGALDHLGFLVATPEDVYAAADALRARRVPLAREPAVHRDGSVSCYCRDPDGNLVQVLYLPGTRE